MPRQGLPELVGALKPYVNDTYSQPRRWENGYSDCSTFVGKGLKRLGIDPPGASTTADYYIWPKLQEIARSQVVAGDFLIYRTPLRGHIAIAISKEEAIGQQRPGRNVQTGSIENNIMYGNKPFKCFRYVGDNPKMPDDKGFLDSIKDYGLNPGRWLDDTIGIFKGDKPDAEKGGGPVEGAIEELPGDLLGWAVGLEFVKTNAMRVVYFIGGALVLAFAVWALLKGQLAPVVGAVAKVKGPK